MNTNSTIPREPYRLTWAATITALILVVPGFIVGGAVVFIYKLFLEGIGIGGNHWIFFLEWLDKVVLVWFPGLMHSTIGGALAIIVTAKLFKYDISRLYSICSIYFYIHSSCYICFLCN